MARGGDISLVVWLEVQAQRGGKLDVVEGTALLATVPDVVARELISLRPNLRTCPLPMALGGSPMELLWRSMVEDDEAIRLIRDLVSRVVKTVESSRA